MPTLPFLRLLAALALNISGEVNRPEGMPFGADELVVEIRSATNSYVNDRTALAADGSFTFGNLEPGTYEFTVRSGNGRILKTQLEQVDRGANRIIINVPRSPNTKPGGAVSLKRMSHKPPADARKLLTKAMRDVDHHREPEAIAKLEAAAKIDPDYFEVRNNLGVRYYVAKNYEKAYAEFSHAAALDPQNPETMANMAASMLGLYRAKEAEAILRRAISQDPSATRFQYLLALSLAQQQRFTPETESLLAAAAPTVPHARLMLAKILTEKGKIVDARRELNAYLATGRQEQRPAVENWLKSLR